MFHVKHYLVHLYHCTHVQSKMFHVKQSIYDIEKMQLLWWTRGLKARTEEYIKIIVNEHYFRSDFGPAEPEGRRQTRPVERERNVHSQL